MGKGRGAVLLVGIFSAEEQHRGEPLAAAVTPMVKIYSCTPEKSNRGDHSHAERTTAQRNG